jgi:hypothetical protein
VGQVTAFRAPNLENQGGREPKGETVPDLAAAFREMREALAHDLLDIEPERWNTALPTRTEWTVKDTVAMLAGFAEALIEGMWTEDYSDAWADPRMRDQLHDAFDRLIAQRKDLTGPKILEEWARHAVHLERMMDGEESFPIGTHPFAGWSYLWAVVQNSHNVWTALGIIPRARNFQATLLCLESAVIWLDMRLQATGRPALRIRAGDREWVVGDGVPQASVTAPAFELFRALSGRRSMDQIRSFTWDGDRDLFLDVFSPFEPPVEAFVE